MSSNVLIGVVNQSTDIACPVAESLSIQEPVTEAGLSQPGESNANCRISDVRVREMRRVRAESRAAAEADPTGEVQPIDWPLLGDMFGISEKHAYRICKGMVRQAAGGIIEPLDQPSKAELLRDFVRCKACGGKHHKHDDCQGCQTLWASLISKAIQPFGWVPALEAA